MNELLQQIHRIGVVPVIKITDPETAVPLARALDKGGIPVAEVTFRTQHAAEAIRRISAEVPQVLTGAGTVTTTEQVDTAVAAAGAKFIVTPGFNPKVVDYCLERNIPILPGASGPSEIEQAMERGLEVVKCFPAEALGGLPYIKALSGPYTEMKFMPTGGVNEKNLLDYLSFNKIICCGGSWMVPGDAVKARDWDRIRTLTASAVQLMLGLEIAHVGINSADEAEAMDTATKLCKLLGWTMKVGNSSIFAGTGIEVMKSPFRGAKGHIGIKTNFIVRAKAYLERQGFEFDESSANVKDGQLKAIYLKDEIAGFAIHLVQK